METESASYKTFKNSTYTFINYVFPIIFSVFITPVIVHRLGVEDFGVFVLVNTIIGFLGLLDIGLGTALIKLISEYYAQEDFVRLQKLLNSANSLFFLIGLASLVIFVVAGTFFLPFFHIASGSTPNIWVVFLLGGIYLFINSANSVFTVLPGALQRFDITTKISLTQLTFYNLATLAAVLMGYKLKVIWALNVFSIIAASIYLVYIFKKLLPQIKFGFAWDKTELKKAYNFGLLAAASNIANSFLTQLDRLVIPMYTNTAQLSYYSLPGNVAQKTTGILNSITGVFFPLISGMSGLGETERIKIIYRRTARITFVIAAAFTVAMSIFSKEILKVWLGQDFSDKGWKILVILAVTYFLLSLFGSVSNFIMGMGKVKFLAVVSIIMAVVNVALLFGLLPKWGILGAAWAYLGAAALTPIVIYIMEKRLMQMNGFFRFYGALCLKSSVVTLVFYFIVQFLLKPFAQSYAGLILIGPFSIVLYLCMYWLFGFFDREDIELFKSYFLQVRSRLNR